MKFEDRVSAYPNRYTMTDENGNVSHVVLERADEPIVPGTPLNAETFNSMLAGLAPAVESAEYPGCYYRIVDGEKEWLNPPLVNGDEYRTTERVGGDTLYVKEINCGILTDQKTLNIPSGIICRWNGFTSAGTPILGNYPASEAWRIDVNFRAEDHTVTFHVGTSAVAKQMRGYLVIWYKKKEVEG